MNILSLVQLNQNINKFASSTNHIPNNSSRFIRVDANILQIRNHLTDKWNHDTQLRWIQRREILTGVA